MNYTKNNPFTGHVSLEKGMYAEIRQFINNWLMDQTVYCNACGSPYFPDMVCCDTPQIGKNIDHCYAILRQNENRRAVRLNQFGSNEKKTLRIGLSMPQDLLRQLEKFSKERFGKKLFGTTKDFRKFIKNFPQFSVCERV